MQYTLSAEANAVQSLFYILDKDSNKVPFIFNKAQATLDAHDNPTGRVRIIIAKARQKGFSAGVLGKFSVRCLGREGTRAVVISHESEATKRLLARVDYYFKHMNGPKPNFGMNSTREMTFPLRDSTYYIGTAGARAFGRGDTITDLHCSEYAWWEKAEKHTSGLFQAVPINGRIYIESTGNGRNNDFFYIWNNAASMGYTKLFYPWFADREYYLPVGDWKPDIPRHNAYLLELQAKHALSAQQMAWYESKLREFREDLNQMQQEYPSEPDECFQATGGSVFPGVTAVYDEHWTQERFEEFYVYRMSNHPNPSYHYIIGGDPSGGTGHDDAAVQVLCVETNEQVFEFANNHTNPIRFAKLLVSVGLHFNEAFIVCESNNHGAAVIPYLRDNYPKGRLYKRKYETAVQPALFGWNNSEQTKHALVGLMLEEVYDLQIHGKQTANELLSFEENAEGRMEGRSDNLVIALGLAQLGCKRFSYLRNEFLRPKVVPKTKQRSSYMVYTLDEVLHNIAKRKQMIAGYGIQTGAGTHG